MDSVVCLLTLIHWIAIYPVDSTIQPLNNRGQINHYPVDSVVCFLITYSLDSDYLADSVKHVLNNWALDYAVFSVQSDHIQLLHYQLQNCHHSSAPLLNLSAAPKG